MMRNMISVLLIWSKLWFIKLFEINYDLTLYPPRVTGVTICRSTIETKRQMKFKTLKVPLVVNFISYNFIKRSPYFIDPFRKHEAYKVDNFQKCEKNWIFLNKFFSGYTQRWSEKDVMWYVLAKESTTRLHKFQKLQNNAIVWWK